MRHETYIREVPGARTAVLMVHGILRNAGAFCAAISADSRRLVGLQHFARGTRRQG